MNTLETSISGTNQPSVDQIIAAVAKQFNAPEAVALSFLTTFARHFDPRAAAERLAERQRAASDEVRTMRTALAHISLIEQESSTPAHDKIKAAGRIARDALGTSRG